jgi:hypothetical protein
MSTATTKRTRQAAQPTQESVQESVQHPAHLEALDSIKIVEARGAAVLEAAAIFWERPLGGY